MRKKSSKKIDVKYPIAFDSLNEELVDIGSVSERNKVHTTCPECGSRFIAVINHRTPHFKHYGDYECTGTVESYIHRIVKELFKRVSNFELPELLIKDLPEEYLRNFYAMQTSLLDSNIPLSQQRKFVNGLKKNLTPVKEVVVDCVEVEKTIKTPLGEIRVDVAAHIGSKVFFIEPFFSNPIDDVKKEKIKVTNTPTLSISLLEFVRFKKLNFSLSDLKQWLFIDNSKDWVYLNDELYQKHINNYKRYLRNEIEKYKRSIMSKEISELKKKNVERENEIDYFKIKIEAIRGQISKTDEQIDKLMKDLDELG